MRKLEILSNPTTFNVESNTTNIERMRLRYNRRSKFLSSLESCIRENLQALNAGDELVITVDEEAEGYPGEALVILQATNPNEFTSDFENADPGRFPSRMRAATTALRNCGCFGEFSMSHSHGVLRIRKRFEVVARSASKEEIRLDRPAQVGLISCVKEKLDRPAPAVELYTSDLFRKSKFYAEQRLDKYFILSAKYGLLRPDDVIEPYELTLRTMRRRDRREWAEKVIDDLKPELNADYRIVFLAGEKYREFLDEELTNLNFEVATPLEGLEFGPQLSWYKSFASNLETVQHLDHFYSLIRRLCHGLEGPHKLGELDPAVLPERGVYFFFEPGEFRKTQPFESRVVRVGTHGLNEGGVATLASRLRAHKGNGTLGGNHRSSVFRRHVGFSLIQELGVEHMTWGEERDPELRSIERQLEEHVSRRIRDMSVIWLAIPDEPGPQSDRGYIERNSIALLSTINRKLDTASSRWLGRSNPNPAIRESSLWNVGYVNADYDPAFLAKFAEYVDTTIG